MTPRGRLRWRLTPPPTLPRCPGLYAPCPGQLRWVSTSSGSGFFGCSMFSELGCCYRYVPHEIVQFPQLATEITGPDVFTVGQIADTRNPGWGGGGGA